MARFYRQGRLSEHIKHGPGLAPEIANRFSLQSRFSPELLQWVDEKVQLLGEPGSLVRFEPVGTTINIQFWCIYWL